MADKKTEDGMIRENNPLANIDISEATIRNLIYTIRGRQVMLDSDLSMLYQVETKRLNETVKRNKNRFPDHFCFQLTEEETNSLRSQFATSNENDSRGGRRYLPYVFTEQGIAMLSAVLRSDVAIRVSIKIMDTFVEMRRFLASNSLMFERINELEVRQLEYQRSADEKFDKIFGYISEREESPQKIFFDGQIYDAFSLMTELVAKAKEKLALIDNYVDIGTLNILAKKKKNIEATIYTSKGTKLSEKDIDNFNSQYPILKIRYTNVFHDRFLIIDDVCAYHIGASVKDAGKKCFGISMILDRKIVKDILERLNIETENEEKSC